MAGLFDHLDPEPTEEKSLVAVAPIEKAMVLCHRLSDSFFEFATAIGLTLHKCKCNMCRFECGASISTLEMAAAGKVFLVCYECRSKKGEPNDEGFD